MPCRVPVGRSPNRPGALPEPTAEEFPPLPKSPAPPTFEDLLARLETIVRSLESEELDLERSIAAFEEGVEIARQCHRRLDEAERRVEVLRRDPSGGVTSEPLDQGAGD